MHARCVVVVVRGAGPGGAPVAMASCSLTFQCLATSSASGSSGFGALSSAWILHPATYHNLIITFKSSSVPTSTLAMVTQKNDME